MEKILIEDFTRTVLIFGMVAAGSFGFMVKLIAKAHGSFKPYFKSTILYFLVALLLMSGIAMVYYWSHLQNQQVFHLIFLVYFMVLGIAHVRYLSEWLKWAGNRQSLIAEFLFTLVLSLLGGVAFMVLYTMTDGLWLAKDSLAFQMPANMSNNMFTLMSTSAILFLVPWMVNQTFHNALAVPGRILKRWYYPLGEEMEEPDEDKLKNLLVISFVIQKHPGDIQVTHFRAKAPVDMDMGELFYYFINDYNERHPNDKIDYLDHSGEPYGWVFYKKNTFIRILNSYVDAEKTIYNNNIRENNVILCNRTLTN